MILAKSDHSIFMMAFVLSPPPTPQFESAFGNPICSRSTTLSLSDIGGGVGGTVRTRLVLRTPSNSSIRTCITTLTHSDNTTPLRPPFLVGSDYKENNSTSKSSLLAAASGTSAQVSATTILGSPRRSRLWNIPADHLDRFSLQRQATPDSEYHFLTATAPNRHECDLTHVRRSLGLEGFEQAEGSDEDNDDEKKILNFSLPCPSSPSSTLSAASCVLYRQYSHPTPPQTPKNLAAEEEGSTEEDDKDEIGDMSGIDRIDFQLNASNKNIRSSFGSTSPFKRWLRTLRKRHLPEGVSHIMEESAAELEDVEEEGEGEEDFDDNDTKIVRQYSSVGRRGHRKNLSSVSSGVFLSAVQTASVTVASASLNPQSRRSGFIRSDDSHAEFQIIRNSYDSLRVASPSSGMDDGTWNRSVQRQRIVDEIISSEESYSRDLKTLLNVYLTVLPRNVQDRKVIRRAVSQILQLHEELITQLQHIRQQHDPLPLKQQQQQQQQQSTSKIRRGVSRHIRWRSWDTSSPIAAVLTTTATAINSPRRERWARHSIDTSRPSLIQSKPLMTDTRLVMDIAKLFDQFMHRFLMYEAYAAYNDLIGDSATSMKTTYGWQEAEKGIEALSVLALPANQRIEDEKKALSFADLIIKPVQRICKYPLFFHDLRRHTPACDDPVAHHELEKVLVRLQKVAEEVDLAMSNVEVRKRIEASWILQQRLEFPDPAAGLVRDGRSSSSSPVAPVLSIIKLGHVLLCGVLHVVYNSSQEGVKGDYMICVLYRSSLVVATMTPMTAAAATTTSTTTMNNQGTAPASVSPLPKKYQIFTVIPLVNAAIEEADNGRGLQCHTAQFTWKLVFEIDRRQQEMLFSACSEMEENCWKSRIRSRIVTETTEHSEGKEKFEPIAMASTWVKSQSIGSSSFFFTNFSRRLSIQRAATVGGAKSNVLQQVILKNTECPKYTNNALSAASVVRSQSHMSSGHAIPTLAPRRQDRIKLEMAVSDIWTKALLPYPGMSCNRMESTIRASANHVMRKLSIASMTSMTSIASTFSKRSLSYSGLSVLQQQRPVTADGGNATVRSTSTTTTASTRTASSSQPSSIGTVRGKLRGRGSGRHATPELKEPQPQSQLQSQLQSQQQQTLLVDFHNTPKAFLPQDFELDIKPRRRSRKVSVHLSVMLETDGCGGGGSDTTSRPSIGTIRPVDENTSSNKQQQQVKVQLSSTPTSASATTLSPLDISSSHPMKASNGENVNADGANGGDSNGNGNGNGHASSRQGHLNKRLARTRRVLMRFFT